MSTLDAADDLPDTHAAGWRGWPALWTTAGLGAIVAAARFAPTVAAAEGAALAAAVFGLVVGAVVLRQTTVEGFVLLGAICVAAAVPQAAWSLAALHGLEWPAAALVMGGQTAMAVGLGAQLLDGQRPRRALATALATALASGLAVAVVLAGPAPASWSAWAPLLPVLLFGGGLALLLREGAPWGVGPRRWLTLSAAGGAGQGLLTVAAGALLPVVDAGIPPASASLSAIAVPLGILLAALERGRIQLMHAELEATSYREANQTLLLSSELARRLQRRVEALRLVRAAMQTPETEVQLPAVLTAVRAALERLRVSFHDCTLNLVEEVEDGSHVLRIHGIDAVERWETIAAGRPCVAVSSWQTRQVVTRNDLHEDDPYEERDALEYLYGRALRSAVDLPFSHGTLSITSGEPAVFDKELRSELLAIAEVLSEGFRHRDEVRQRREIEKRLDSFFNLSLDLLCVATFDGYLRMVNPAWTATLGYAFEELVSRPLQDFIHPEDLRGTLTAVARLRRGDPTTTFENRFQHKDGSIRWLLWTAARDPEGRYVYGTAHDITERVLAEADLQRAKEEAEAARLAQSRFLATMNHELRTPLSAIIGYSELLMEEAEDDGADAAGLVDLRRIRASAQQLLRMISEILEVSRIEAGRVELRLEDVPLTELVEEVVAAHGEALAAHDSRLATDLDEAPGALHTDRLKVRQILGNLLSNAAKFTEHGTVTVSARSRERDGTAGVEIAVTDTGVGMTAAESEFIFDAFRQIDGSTKRRHGGTGLGLTISRRLCDMLGGDIGVTSTPGEGSTFTLWLPVHSEAVAPPTPLPATPARPERT